MKIMTANLSTDYSVYVTIMNQVSNILSFDGKTNKYGTYNPINLPPYIQSNNEIYFILQGDLFTGSEGSVTYDVDGKGQKITFAFQCPQVSDNALSIPLNQTNFHITYYGGTDQPIQWNPNGTNWGQPNNFPKRGHPLYALFVIKPSENAIASFVA
jgi:hypothetical protein